MEQAHDAISTAERIHHQLTQPFEIDGHRMFISTSIGVVLNIAEYTSPEEILRDADIAMYHAKSMGRARYAVFDTRMRDQTFARAEIESDLRGAVERQEFRLYYQPIVSLEDGCFVGVEALIRWQHPRRGLLAPAEFIGVAEETGLIIPIGKWVIREACRQMHDWQSRFANEPPISIHVNLSAKQVCHPSLTREIKQALQETGLAPGSLSLEITESVLMENNRVAVEVLKELQAWGVRVELDDFGTGYSSLNYLHQFPINGLKVDRTFVKKMEESDNNPGIVQAIIKLGHDLGMEIVAEGLETPSQLRQLKELECDYGQGYYFAKPLEVKAIEDLMQTSQDKSLHARH
jgi:EAL domain-containing protein (putative c-di-GMP-specific phosphodiesterase class I)